MRNGLVADQNWMPNPEKYFVWLGFVFLLFSNPAMAADPIIDWTALKDGQEGRAAVNPCEDFYQFACGSWVDRSVIPAEKSEINRSTTNADDEIDLRLFKTLNAYQKGGVAMLSKNEKKLADFFTSCMNRDRQEKESAEILKKDFQKLFQLGGQLQFAQHLAHVHMAGGMGPNEQTKAFFLFKSFPNPRKSSQEIADFVQAGLGLDQRDFYIVESKRNAEVLRKYRRHIEKMMLLAGRSQRNAKAAAGAVLEIELMLAKASYNIADSGDPGKTTHLFTFTDLQKHTPHFNWAAYFQELAIPVPAEINVEEPEYLDAFEKILARGNQSGVRAYLAWHFLRVLGPKLNKRLDNETFAFEAKFIEGAKKPEPRWKRCVHATEAALPYPLAEAYVKTIEGETIRRKTAEMVADIHAAFKEDFELLSHGAQAWMDEATAQKAKEKLELVVQLVGAPDSWPNFDALKVFPGSYARNHLASRRFKLENDLQKIGKPVDRLEWTEDYMAWVINAGYDGQKNSIVLPFGILQPPSFDVNAGAAANYGAFGGATVGHELTHGFDTNGNQYDGSGNLVNWWSESTLKRFKEKSQCFVEQANSYKVKQVDSNVSGETVLAENLADQGGVKLGYRALELRLSRKAEAKSAVKYSERQQYWIAFAQNWCSKFTNEKLREMMTIDEHPVPEFRVNGVLMNRPEFARDFQCKPGSPMVPERRCSLW